MVGGKIYLYINTTSAENGFTDQVWADIHLVTSPDGKKFSKPILVLDHFNPDVIGYGDELGPTGILHNNGKWSLYYYAKGRGVSSWGLCLATGDSPISFATTKSLIDENAFFGSGGDVHWVSSSKIAMFFQRRRNWGRIEVYTAPADHPDMLTRVQVWEDLACEEGVTVFMDKQAGKWFMYNRSIAEDNKMFVRIAPITYVK
jgi:hypothetical protein